IEGQPSGVVPSAVLAATVAVATLLVLALALLGSVVVRTVADARAEARTSVDLLRTLRRMQAIIAGVGIVLIAAVVYAAIIHERWTAFITPFSRQPHATEALRDVARVAAEHSQLATAI